MLAAIESELLQLRLLRALEQAGFLDELVLLGGAALRLCYRGNRYNDVLSFAGGADFTLQHFLQIKQCLEADLGAQYELRIVNEISSTLYKEAENAISQVDLWALTVTTSACEGAHQTARLEVLRARAHTAHAMPVQLYYDWLPPGYTDMLAMVESKGEILAFMLASLPSLSGYARCMCLWDLAWLMRLGATMDVELLKLKIAGQRYSTAEYLKHIERLACDMQNIIRDDELAQTMKSLLPADVFERNAGSPSFHQYLVAVLSDLLSDVHKALTQKPSTQSTFRM